MRTLLTSAQLKQSTAGVQLVNGEYRAGEVMTSNDWMQLAIVKLLQSYNGLRRAGFSHADARAEALRTSSAGKEARETALAIIDTHPQDWEV